MVPLVSGRTRVVDVCRNCRLQTTEIYTSGGHLIRWRNDGKLPVEVA